MTKIIKRRYIVLTVFTIVAAQIISMLAYHASFSLAQIGDIPTAPSGLVLNGTATSTAIPLRWTDNSINEDKFNVDRKLTTATDWMGAWTVQIPNANTTTYTDTSVTAGTVYDYRVQSCLSGTGCSEYVYLIGISSASGSSVPLAPSSLMLDGTPTSSSVSIKWTDNANNEDRFTVQRKLSSASWSSFIPDSNNSFLVSYPNAISYVDTSVAAGTTYDYRVAACKEAVGCSDYAYLSGISSANNTECLLTVSVNSATSPAQNINAGQNGVSLVKFNLVSNCAIALNSFAVSLLPMPNGFSNISFLRLYKEGTQIGSTLNNPVAGANFSGLNLAIGAGQTIVLEAKGDISSSAAVGSTVYGAFGGSSATSYLGSVGNNASGNIFAGNLMTIVAGSTTTTATCTGLTLILNDGKTAYTTSESVNFTWTCTPGGIASNVYLKLYRSSDNILALSLPNGPASIGTETRYLSTSSLSVGSYILKACFDPDCKPDAVYVGKGFTVVSGTASTPAPMPGITPTPTPISTAVPTPTTFVTPYLNLWVDAVASTSYASPTVISGTKLAYVASNVSFPTDSLIFHIYRYSLSGTVDLSQNYYIPTVGKLSLVSGSEGKKWTGTINTSNLPNGNYKFYAKGLNNGTGYMSNNVYFAVNDSTAVIPSVSPVPVVDPKDPVISVGINYSVSGYSFSGTKNIWAKSNLPLTGLTFKFYNTASSGFIQHTVIASPSDSVAGTAVAVGFNYWSGVLDTAKLNNGGYKLIAKGVYNGYSYENSAPYYFNVDNSALNGTPVPASTPFYSPVPVATPSPYSSFDPKISPYPAASPFAVPAVMYVPSECQQKGFITPESCQKYFQFPWECRQQNILDGLKCQEYMFKFAMPEICRQKGVTTQEECAKIVLLNSFPQECKDANITDETKCVSFISARTFLTVECKEAGISDFSACGNYMTEKFMPKECVEAGAKTKEDCDYIMRNKYGNFAQETAVAVKMISPQIAGGVSPECRDKGITDPMVCEKHMVAKYLPEECKAANIATKEGCEKFLFEKNAPKECIDAKINSPKDCENYMFKRNAPQDCADAGIASPEKCKKYMFDKYNGVENIPIEKFPIDCRKAGVKTADECEKIMTQKYLPDSCKSQGLTSEKDCAIYLKQKGMPKECQAEGVKNEKDCNKVLFKKFAPEECKKAGIENEKECNDFLFNLYAPKTVCKSGDEWQCKNSIKENHLGAISAKQVEYAKVKDEITSLAGGSAVKTEVLREKMGESREIIPIKDNGANLKIIKTEENMVLNEDDDLIQTASAAVMVDSDNDGLTDDMEKRVGTDPKNPDSDSDGYKDGDEVKAGYNPLGEGKFAVNKIAPIDEAIMNDRTLSHPKVEGIESDKYTFNQVANLNAAQGNADNVKYLFSGKADSDSVVTLYIYSDLPIVMTVKTDKYGNWNYEFDKSLMDGEHEAYVVLNDNTGKVVTRSAVMNFFVKEAKATTVKDYIAPESIAPLTKSEKSMKSYVLITFGIIFVGIIVFVGYIVVRRKRIGSPKA